MNNGETIETKIGNREWSMLATEAPQFTQQSLQARGFEPATYIGSSKPVGPRQRVTKSGLFYRVAATGEFVRAI